MQMSIGGNMSISDEVLLYAKKYSKKLISSLCNIKQYPSSKNPFTIFMAGSPGAGKTEFSKNLLKQLKIKNSSQKVIRLDTDELRELLPQYNGSNSDEVQRAATLLFDKAYDFVQKNNQSVIVDTTFASPRSIQNIKRALNRGRKVGILYLHQDPLIAWDYTKKREKVEGRVVPKKVFINAYFSARENVKKVKQKFGDKIELSLFEKDKSFNFLKKARFNIKTLDEYIKNDYSINDLEKMLADEL